MKKNNKKGFTLVELVIVVAVMAILVAVAIPTVASVTAKAQSAVDASNAQTIESMLKLEMADQNKASLSETEVAQTIVDAKLGITKGVFYYDTVTGAVEATGAQSETVYKIDFTTTGKVSVQKSGGTAVVKDLTTDVTPESSSVGAGG